jgi:hypothetical protein
MIESMKYRITFSAFYAESNDKYILIFENIVNVHVLCHVK